MKQVFIVMEGNGESYEDYHAYSVAAFSNKEDADNHATQLQKEYDKKYALGMSEQEDYEKELGSLECAIPFNWLEDDAEYANIYSEVSKYVDAKYPNAAHLDYSKHSFFVAEPVPFIK